MVVGLPTIMTWLIGLDKQDMGEYDASMFWAAIVQWRPDAA
jgi:hypothetical protein